MRLQFFLLNIIGKHFYFFIFYLLGNYLYARAEEAGGSNSGVGGEDVDTRIFGIGEGLGSLCREVQAAPGNVSRDR